MLQRESKQKELGQISRDVRERNTRAPVLRATVMCSDTGVMTILDDQIEIFQAAAESNRQRQCKTEGTAFRTLPCYRILDTAPITKQMLMLSLPERM